MGGMYPRDPVVVEDDDRPWPLVLWLLAGAVRRPKREGLYLPVLE
jgi:hypothetical protein